MSSLGEIDRMLVLRDDLLQQVDIGFDFPLFVQIPQQQIIIGFGALVVAVPFYYVFYKRRGTRAASE